MATGDSNIVEYVMLPDSLDTLTSPTQTAMAEDRLDDFAERKLVVRKKAKALNGDGGREVNSVQGLFPPPTSSTTVVRVEMQVSSSDENDEAL